MADFSELDEVCAEQGPGDSCYSGDGEVSVCLVVTAVAQIGAVGFEVVGEEDVVEGVAIQDVIRISFSKQANDRWSHQIPTNAQSNIMIPIRRMFFRP